MRLNGSFLKTHTKLDDNAMFNVFHWRQILANLYEQLLLVLYCETTTVTVMMSKCAIHVEMISVNNHIMLHHCCGRNVEDTHSKMWHKKYKIWAAPHYQQLVTMTTWKTNLEYSWKQNTAGSLFPIDWGWFVSNLNNIHS